MSAGKGDTPRPTKGKEFRSNYDNINWTKQLKKRNQNYAKKHTRSYTIVGGFVR